MKTCWILIFVSVIGIVKIVGQTENIVYAAAEKLFAYDRFADALPYYFNLLKLDSSNANLNFKIGLCYLNSRSQKAKAVYFLNKALTPTTSYYSEGSLKKTKEPFIAYNYLGTCQLSYSFDQLNKSCEKFKKIITDCKDKDLSAIEVVDLKIGINKITEELNFFNTSSINLKIENINKNHHSVSVDYTSVLLPNHSMIFTFHKPDEKTGVSDEDKLFFEDSDISTFQVASVNIVADTINNINKNEATIATSEDKQTILTYKDENGNGNLYISRLNGNQWTVPEKLDKAINNKGWEPNECISSDGNTLYFTSNRRGGYGGIDIYKSKKLPNGEWSIATNLGPVINTTSDERAPFIHADGITLYFSSNGHNTTGSFDILACSLSDSGTWSKPVNIGYPASKILDDTLYPVTADNKKNNSSTPNKKGSQGNSGTVAIKKVESNEDENYTVTFSNQKQVLLTLLKSTVYNLNGEVPRDLEITISDNETGAIISTHNSNNRAGNYLLILPPGRNNNITYQADGYLCHSDNVDLSDKNCSNEIYKAVEMPFIGEGATIVLNNIFFESGKATLRQISNVELNNLFQLLTRNPTMVVKISDFIITSKENIKRNKKLSRERAQEIRNYLIEKGISKENIIANGYVKSKSYEPKVAQNRSDSHIIKQSDQWVELKIVEIK